MTTSPASIADVLEDGMVACLLGPAGSGTSRLLDGLAATNRPWPATAVVPQRLVLVDELTVGENLHLTALLGRRPPTDEEGWIECLGLGHLLGRAPASISVGEQQRTMIARALLADPALLLADEPIAHQAPLQAAAVMDALVRHARRGRKVVIATHDPAVAERADRVLDLDARPGPGGPVSPPRRPGGAPGPTR